MMADTDSTVIAIPARLESARLPGKPLLLCGERPLLWHTWRRAAEWAGEPRVFIVTDSPQVQQVMGQYGASVILDERRYHHGSARVLGALDQLPPSRWVINLQCDEPEVRPEHFATLIQSCRDQFQVRTLASRFQPARERHNPSEVKVLVAWPKYHPSPFGQALYFTRQPLLGALRHIGVYAFWRSAMPSIVYQPYSQLAELERLEQLEWLDGRIPIGIADIDSVPRSINTKEDLQEFNAYLKGQDADAAGTS